MRIMVMIFFQNTSEPNIIGPAGKARGGYKVWLSETTAG